MEDRTQGIETPARTAATVARERKAQPPGFVERRPGELPHGLRVRIHPGETWAYGGSSFGYGRRSQTATQTAAGNGVAQRQSSWRCITHPPG